MTRWQELLRKDAVAKQDTDDKIGDYQAKKAMVDSGRANVKRLEDTVSFEKVYAPFDGVITARNTDIGALINAGNGGASQQLFTLAATNTLRVFVNVPQTYSRSAGPGVVAQLTLAEYPNRRFPGQIARNSEAIDPSTRTLLTEVDVDNSTGALFAGRLRAGASYARREGPIAAAAGQLAAIPGRRITGWRGARWGQGGTGADRDRQGLWDTGGGGFGGP